MIEPLESSHQSGVAHGALRRGPGAPPADAAVGPHRHDLLQDAADEEGRDAVGRQAPGKRPQNLGPRARGVCVCVCVCAGESRDGAPDGTVLVACVDRVVAKARKILAAAAAAAAVVVV